MLLSVEKRTIVSFGVFELDLEAGELRKAGLRVKLQGQPFRVLKALLSKPGEVVTREELQREIWGVNTNIDFERGIAGAVNKIREALGDSADNPRYVETLARRGFRFIAPVRLEVVPPKTLEPSGTPLHSPDTSADVETTSFLTPPPPSSDVPAPLLPPSGGASPVPEAAPTRGLAGAPAQASAPRNLGGIHAHPWRVSLAAGCILLIAASGWVAAYLQAHKRTFSPPPRIQQLTSSSTIYSGPPNAENFLSLVTDGPHIYTTVENDGRLQVASMDLSGTPGAPIDLPDELQSVSVTDISRDGSKLLVRSRASRDPEQPLWIVPTSGSTAFRLGEVVAHDATWTPDGESILFAVGNELRTLSPVSGKVQSYATVPGRAFWPRWSPDGKTLRFTLLDPTTHVSTLWQSTAADPHPRPMEIPQLANRSLCCGSWTSDGNTYVLQASNPTGSDIWAIENGGRKPAVQLTNGPLHFQSPLPGLDGKQLYFIGLEQPAATRFYDPGRRSFVPAPPYLAHARRITYSRDGKWLAWTDTSGRLWRARSTDGSGRLQLSEEDLEVFLAQWAPDGRQLVMMARKPGETWKIFTVDSTGGVPHLVASDTRNLADPDWSADGRSIVFGQEADLMGKEGGPHNLLLLELATHHMRPIPGSDNLFSPRWSPDGRWILALSQDQNLLKLFDVEHGTWKTLYSGGVADPVWSADSRFIYFHAYASKNSAIMRLQLNGDASVAADLSQIGLPGVDNYFFSGVTPSGAPIIEPKVGTGNLYSVDLSGTTR